jgi:hypothetical protein
VFFREDVTISKMSPIISEHFGAKSFENNGRREVEVNWPSPVPDYVHAMDIEAVQIWK